MHLVHRGSPDYGRADNVDYDSRRWRGSSPPWNSVKRKRSPSPHDRFVRFRHDDPPHYGRDRYSRSTGGRPVSPERRGPPDPTNRDALATFRQYSEWFKYTYPDEWKEDDTQSDTPELSTVRTRYDDYRRAFIRKQYTNMFEYHRTFAWFIEKYDMADRFVDMRDRVRQQGWKDRIAQFMIELEGGKFDPVLPGHEPSVQTSKVRGDDDELSNNDDGVQTNSNEATATQPGPGEHMVAPSNPQLLIRTLPPDIGRLKLEEVLCTLSGFKYVAIGDPVQKRQFYRSAWVAFEFEDDVRKAIKELELKKVENFRLPVSHISEPFKAKIRYTPACASKPGRMEKDLEQAKKLVNVLETQAAEVAAYKPSYPIGAPPSAEPLQIEDTTEAKEEEADIFRGSKAVEERIDKLASETLDTDENGNPDQAKRTALSLDMYLTYLREAFNCCYYCALITDHHEELIRKCIKHERREEPSSSQQGEAGDAKEHPKGNTDTYSEERWAESLDHKLACLIDPTTVDARDYGGTRLEDERARMTAPHVSKEEEGKWRCHECKKLFKAAEFVEKHVLNKHGELCKAQLEEWELYNNFILDPQRITPMQAIPMTTTGATQHPPQAFGLPRSSYGGYDRNSRDYRDRDRHPTYSRRSPSPIPFNNPIRFAIDADTASITIKGVNGSISLPPIPGLPAKPVGAMHSISAMSTPSAHSNGLLERMSAPPPPGQKPDPRSRVSYHDLDMADSSEDVALQY